jgi:hypothetical protein
MGWYYKQKNMRNVKGSGVGVCHMKKHSLYNIVKNA